MPLADHDYVVKAFPTNRANHPLGVRVLPGRARRNYRFSDAQCFGLTRKSFSINLVSIPNQVSGPLLQRARLEQLARRPFRSRMLRDIKMHQPTPAVGQHHEHEHDSKGRGRYREERMFATPATAASEAGPCTSTPSPARQSGRASTARRGSSAHPTADSRGPSAVSDSAGPSQPRADPIGVDSSMPSRA